MGIVSVKTGEAAKLAYPIDLETIRFVDEKLTERAMQFIAGRMGEKNPIFLYMGTSGASGNPWIGSGAKSRLSQTSTCHLKADMLALLMKIMALDLDEIIVLPVPVRSCDRLPFLMTAIWRAGIGGGIAA